MSLFKKIFQGKTENFSDATWYLKAQDLWNYDTANYSNPQKALKYLENSIQVNPNKAEAFMGQGTAYLQLGKHQKAINAFNQVIHITPNDGVAYLNRGIAYMQSENYEKAIEDFNQLLHMEPDYFTLGAYLHRGLAYWISGRHQQAIEDYSQLISLDPNDASNYNIRGLAYSETGKQKEAIVDFDKALRLQPQWAEAYNNREIAYKRLKTHNQKPDTNIGIVRDTKTGLEWYAGPDKNTNWSEAKSWVENLTVAGGDWRMPTLKELKTLYQTGEKRNIRSLFKTTAYWVWSGETKDSSSACGFNFGTGGEGWLTRDGSNYLRGFAVRFRR